ncbi:MAG: hypothetical protein IKV28_05720 [Bacteroidales bacterium]|nr:hypothetical protein [Bacteroidales bacterium]
MSKFAKYLLYVLLACSTVLVVVFFAQSSSGVFNLSNLGNAMSTSNMADGLLWWTYALVFLAIALVIILSVVKMAQNPKSLKRTGFVTLLAVVLCAVSYFLASGAPIHVNLDVQPTEATLKLTDAGLILTYLLFAGAILALLYGSVRKMINNR